MTVVCLDLPRFYWACSRLSNLEGLDPRRMFLASRGLRGKVVRTKTTGPGKQAKETPIFMSRRPSSRGHDWMRCCKFLLVVPTPWMTHANRDVETVLCSCIHMEAHVESVESPLSHRPQISGKIESAALPCMCLLLWIRFMGRIWLMVRQVLIGLQMRVKGPVSSLGDTRMGSI